MPKKRRNGRKLVPSDFEEAKLRSNVVPSFTNADKFLDAKLKMLRDDFLINITPEDEAYLRSFKTEADINAAVRQFINNAWR